MMSEPEWRRLNRANWDERVAIHMAPESDYDTHLLRQGNYILHAIEERELGPVAGLRLLHLQCHFGVDTLALAQKGAQVTGLDFSAPAIAAARSLAAEIGIEAHFVQSDIYEARAALEGEFDRVFTTWGTIGWLPDIQGWAEVVASLLRVGGEVYFADMHPAALIFDDDVPGTHGMPGWFAPYFHQGEIVVDDARDYANPVARLSNLRTHQFMHPVASVVQALLDAGLRLTMLHEHDTLAWKQFGCMIEAEGGLYRLPEKPWLPLSYSLKAIKP
jgi:2-polyprenyl-3-methyl-5-hydroxy-6-metoxy-1,4-benzoquinol methylase